MQAADKPAVTAPGWNPVAATQYLDSRETWWQGWGRAQKDHGTLCVSCHTQATYAMARPVLRSRSGEREPSAQEQVMLASVEKRVRDWKMCSLSTATRFTARERKWSRAMRSPC